MKFEPTDTMKRLDWLMSRLEEQRLPVLVDAYRRNIDLLIQNGYTVEGLSYRHWLTEYERRK